MRNNLLCEKLTYTGSNTAATRIQLSTYNSKSVEEAEGYSFKEISSKLENKQTNWLQVYGIKDTETIREICEHFEIDYLVLQDILNVNHPTKVEEHENYIVLILKLFHFNETERESEMEQQQLCLIQGPNYVISFLEYDSPFFENISTAIQHNTLKIKERGSDYLLSVLLNNVMSNYVQIVSSIDDDLEDLEEELLHITNAKDIGIQIQALRKQYLQIKRAVLPLKDQYAKFLRADSLWIHKANRPFYNEVNDHLQFILQTIEICRETLSSLVDLYISNNDLKRNDIMTRLTVVSTIFIPLTFLVGVWGMNFSSMPELNWKYGYLFAWLLMLVIGITVYFIFKKKKWY